MATKIFKGAGGYLGIIYANRELWPDDELTAITQRFADLLAGETGGSIVQVAVL